MFQLAPFRNENVGWRSALRSDLNPRRCGPHASVWIGPAWDAFEMALRDRIADRPDHSSIEPIGVNVVLVGALYVQALWGKRSPAGGSAFRDLGITAENAGGDQHIGAPAAVHRNH